MCQGLSRTLGMLSGLSFDEAVISHLTLHLQGKSLVESSNLMNILTVIRNVTLVLMEDEKRPRIEVKCQIGFQAGDLGTLRDKDT